MLDDEEDVLHLLELVLSRRGFRVSVTADGREALRLLRESRFAVALVDLLMPGMSGRQFLEQTGKLPPEQRPNVLIVSALRPEMVEKELGGLPYFALVSKPFELSQIHEPVVRAAEAWRTRGTRGA